MLLHEEIQAKTEELEQTGVPVAAATAVAEAVILRTLNPAVAVEVGKALGCRFYSVEECRLHLRHYLQLERFDDFPHVADALPA